MPISLFSATHPGKELRLGDQLIRFDREMTQNAYRGITTDSAAECGCSFCRNFVAQRAYVYPASFLALLDQLGIDPAKESEVYECGPTDDGKRFYGGWLFFSGQLLEIGERHVENDGIEYWIRESKQLPVPNGEFGLNCLAIEFATQIPWVLAEQP
jgi:hypothetical protein